MPVLAIGGVELVALIVALAAVLVLLALWVFGKPIASALGHVPGIGGTLESYLNAGIQAAVAGIAKVLDSVTHAAAHLMWMLATGVWHLLYQLTATIADAKSWAIRAWNLAQSAALQAAGNLAAAVSTEEGYAGSLVAGALSTVRGWVATAEADAAAGVAAAEASAAGALATAEAGAQALFNAATAEITTVASDVISEANRLFGQAEADATAALDAAEAVIGEAIAGVQGDITGVANGLQGLVGQLAPYLGALGLLGSIPLLSTAVQALTAEADQCLKPLCDTVTPRAPQLGGLGQFLANIENLGIDVLVTALFTEAVTNPGGVASEAGTVVHELGDPVVSGIRTLTGL